MKKNLLIILSALFATAINAQVIFFVEPPSDVSGLYPSGYSTTDWGSPDLNDPANSVTGEMVMAIGGIDDSTICSTVVNADEVSGKIAVFYRGACQFGTKALNAQNAGAIACVLINNVEGVFGPTGGDDGPSVTIPLIMVGPETGALLRPEIEAGGLIGFMGTRIFDNNIALQPKNITMAPSSSYPTVLAENFGDYPLFVGATIINFGNNEQTNVNINATITKSGVVLYNETSEDSVTMASLDTTYIPLPDFVPDSYEAGSYEFDYTLISDSVDEFPNDNELGSTFLINDSLFSYGKMDAATGNPIGETYFTPGGHVDGEKVQQCYAFVDANAHKVNVKGLTFSVAANQDMTGLEMVIFAYQWNNEFDDLNDPNFDITDDSVEELDAGAFTYTSDDLQFENVYVPFDEVLTLEDNVRYLFCVTYFDGGVFLGYNNPDLDYDLTINSYLQPLWPLEDVDAWFWAGFGFDVAPAMSVNMFDPLADAINEEATRINITPFPNPATNELYIPIGNNSGSAVIDVYDVAGKLVITNTVLTSSNENLRMDISTIDNGAYIFKMRFEDGSFSNFNVVVSK